MSSFLGFSSATENASPIALKELPQELASQKQAVEQDFLGKLPEIGKLPNPVISDNLPATGLEGLSTEKKKPAPRAPLPDIPASIVTAKEHLEVLWPRFHIDRPLGCKAFLCREEAYDDPLKPYGNRLLQSMEGISPFYRRDPQMKAHALKEAKRTAELCQGGVDVYASMHVFRNRSSRVSTNLHSLTGFVVDLDVKNYIHWNESNALFDSHAWIDAQINHALNLLKKEGFPEPNFLTFTGRGAHLYWMFDRPLTHKAVRRWSRAMGYLLQILIPAGADPSVRDSSRVLRLVGTYNSKVSDSNTRLKLHQVHSLVLNQQRYSFDALCDKLFPCFRHEVEQNKAYREKQRKEQSKRRKQAEKLRQSLFFNGHSRRNYQRFYLSYSGKRGVNICRLFDLLRLAQALGRIPEGYRSRFLLHCAAFLSFICRSSQIYSIVKNLRDLYCPDFPESEIASQINCVIRHTRVHENSVEKAKNNKDGSKKYSVIDGRYLYNNNSLLMVWGDLFDKADIKPMSIVPSEQTSINSKVVERLRFSEKCNSGLGVRDADLERCRMAQQMQKEGKTYRQIAEKLGIAIGTVHNWVKVDLVKASEVIKKKLMQNMEMDHERTARDHFTSNINRIIFSRNPQEIASLMDDPALVSFHGKHARNARIREKVMRQCASYRPFIEKKKEKKESPPFKALPKQCALPFEGGSRKYSLDAFNSSDFFLKAHCGEALEAPA